MSDTQNLKVSKYSFDDVEKRLDTIKFDQLADHFLNGEGKYVQVNTTGGSQYDDTDIKNDLQDLTGRVDTVETGLVKIGDVDALNTTAKDTVVNAVNELDGKITNIQQNGYDDTDIKDSIGTLTDLTTVEHNSLVGAINELDADKVDKTELDAYTKTDDMNLLLAEKADKTDLVGKATETFVIEKINEAQLGGAGQIDLSIYQTKDEIGTIADLSTTDKGTIVGAINEVKNLIDNSSETVVVNCMCASTGFSGLTFTSKDKTFTEINDLIVTEKKTVIVELTDTTTTSKYILYYRGANNRLDGGVFTNTDSHDFYGSAKIDGVEKTIILKVNSDDSAVLELSTNRYVQLFVDCASGGGTFGLMGKLDKTFEEISKEFHAKNIVEVIAWDNTTMTSCLLSIAYVGENLIKFIGIGDFDGVTKRIVLTIDNQNNQNLEAVDIGGSTIEFDDEPLQDSENAVKSGGVFTELQKKQDKLTGKQGQTVGFDKDGNVIAEGTPVTTDQFTFLVNDSQTFNEWIGNDVANGGDATKYESVYIAKGNYTASNTTTQTNGIYYAINLTKTGTKKIYAESGAKITFVGAYHNNDVVGVGYEQIPSDTENYSVHGLTVRAQVDGVNENGYRVVCFYNMVNITECIAESNCNTKTDGGVRVEGFKNCDSLARCKATDFVAGFTDGVQLTKKLSSIGFSYCVDLLECESYPSVKENTTATNDVNGYENCVNMVRCIGNSNEKYVVVCIAGQSNAVGYDESIVDTKFLSRNRDTNRIKQLAYKNTNNLKIIPLDYCADNVQDMTGVVNAGGTNGTKGLHLPLANLMLDYIPEDYSILVLPVAYGSTGFTNGNDADYDALNMKPNRFDGNLKWGANSSLYQTLRDRIKYVLNLNPENIFAGVVWIQGEDDKDNAADHLVGFEAMTDDLFNVLNAENLGGRTPKGNWDRDIWYNIETVAYWYNQGQCQQIWDNYKAWNPNTYVEIPRDVDSNEVGGNEATSRTKPSHYGNNAFTTDIAPRVLQKMIDMNTFGTKGFGIASKKEAMEETIGSTYFPNVPVVKDGEKVLEQSDLYNDTSSTVGFTIDVNGKCTLSEDIVTDLYVTKKPQIILGDVSKLDFEVKRSLYWLIIERDKDSDSLLVVGFGTRNTGLVSKIVGTDVQVVTQAPGNLGQNFPIGTRVRVYRNVDSSVSIYYKLPTSTSYVKWFDVEAYGLLPDRTFGFACGISSYETNGSYNGELNVLFDTMRIQKDTPYPNYQVSDIKISELEALVSDLVAKVTALEQVQSP